jgi:hypothetical protein
MSEMIERLSRKERKWLEHIEIMSRPTGAMYDGDRVDFVPRKIGSRFHRLGFVELFTPYNPDHKERWIITDKGRAALQESKSDD